MLTNLGRFALLVHDYDEAFQFYTEKLGFETLADIKTPDGQRYLHVGLPGQAGVGIWFHQAENEAQRAQVGNQAAGGPFFVVYTDDCHAAYKELLARGVRFRREPQESPEHAFAHFEDLYGNEIVLVELKGQQQEAA